MNANMHQNDMQLKYTWQVRHAKRNHANRHHGSLVISNTKSYKTLLVKDLVKIRKTGQKLLSSCCTNRGKLYENVQQHDIEIYEHGVGIMMIRYKQESKS